MDGRELRRTRSESAVPEPQRTRVRVTHRPTASVSRAAPILPPLELPGELRVSPLSMVHEGPAGTNGNVPLFEELRREPTPPRPVDPEEQGNVNAPDGLIGMIMELLGYAGPNAKARRELVYLIFYLMFGFAQFVIIITLSAYGAHVQSPIRPGETEWRACERPLGVWNVLWLIRVCLGSLLAFWTWKRDRVLRMLYRRIARRQAAIDAEMATSRYRNMHPQDASHVDNTFIEGGWFGAGNELRRAKSVYTYIRTSQITDEEYPSPSYTSISRCTTLISLVWFLVAHILAYTSVNTCRFTSPHIWWLTFGIICILYVMVLEIFLLGLLVFILGPVLYLVYNIVLLCFGRHPLQNPHFIKPDIGKLPKAVVEKIPLVLYIPPPPGESEDGITSVSTTPAPHAYPPESLSSAANATVAAPTEPTPPAPPRRRFAFFRRKRTSKDKSRSPSAGTGDGKLTVSGAGGREDAPDDADVPWDEMWEKSEYPFVRLEGNRAVCAICLMDFEAPRRVRGPGVTGVSAGSSLPTSAQTDAGAQTQDVQVEEVTEEEREALHLTDAGEGAQPLRLLWCSHAFHQTCVDPWLTDVSGRCPTCQRPVELPEPSKKAKRPPRQPRRILP
ncbi:hypothetical protein BC628DRAFT_1324439 [Trametes gibbosa]|uniref:RING-type domain-containing protein n=1 Tax=Trametes gibbosa TaxID=160864 RepID=A0A6G6FQS2_9APHY|nr:hypothetical protein BC628DRAFT_1324439 [Trametes gibbosa]QIE48570.1 hypothetical protein [Trametes gibbosa]